MIWTTLCLGGCRGGRQGGPRSGKLRVIWSSRRGPHECHCCMCLEYLEYIQPIMMKPKWPACKTPRFSAPSALPTCLWRLSSAAAKRKAHAPHLRSPPRHSINPPWLCALCRQVRGDEGVLSLGHCLLLVAGGGCRWSLQQPSQASTRATTVDCSCCHAQRSTSAGCSPPAWNLAQSLRQYEAPPPPPPHTHTSSTIIPPLIL